MRRAVTRSSLLGVPLFASVALALPTHAAGAALRLPDARTDKVLHVRGNSALLTGTVNPQGSPTTAYFQFGPTAAYGYRTPNVNAGSGSKPFRVGQFASPFTVAYHYRIVATNAAGTRFGKDRVFFGKTAKFGIELFKPAGPAPYGTKILVSGRIVGPAFAGRPLALQSSPWPYHEAFEDFGGTVVTNSRGLFAFRVGALYASTQFRVTTLDALPRVSKVIKQEIAPRVTLKVRKSSKPGLVRLYGTVTPVEAGARVEIQVQKPARPGKTPKKEERTFRFATQALTLVKKATKRFSRFSVIISLRRSGRYRAFVIPRPGAIVAGPSNTISLRAAPGKHGKRR
jgi:hypothetical protein